MKDFARISAGKAHDLTKTGSNFPLETELIYSDDSDSDDMADDLQRDETAGNTMKSLKSADAAASKAINNQQQQQEPVAVQRQRSDEPPKIQ